MLRVRRPAPPLDAFVKLLWTFDGFTQAHAKERIMPDGAIALVINLHEDCTRIYDRTTGKILQGRVPAGSVVVPGTLPSADGKFGLYCAVIVKRVDAQTRSKTSINDLLRATD